MNKCLEKPGKPGIMVVFQKTQGNSGKVLKTHANSGKTQGLSSASSAKKHMYKVWSCANVPLSKSICMVYLYILQQF